MNSETKSVWLGYRNTGGMFEVKHDDMKRGIAILGQGASDLATLFGYACDEAGLKTLIIDTGGEVTDRVSGYITSYEPAYFLYDVLRIDESASIHGQLAASAYSCSLDLSFEQEGIVNSAMQLLAAERGVASPSAVSDLMIFRNEQFKGRPVDRLKARLASLSSLNIVGETGTLKELLKDSAILDFSSLGQPEAVEAAVSLLIAKVLAMLQDKPEKEGHEPHQLPDVMIITHSNRLFRVRPVFRRTERLLTTFVASPLPKVLTSDSVYGMDEHFEETCSIRMVSSSLWNEDRRKAQILLPNMFMVRHDPYGTDTPFIPRDFEPKSGGSKSSMLATVTQPDDPELIRQILEDISLYETPTRQSVASFISLGHERELVEQTLDKLQNEGFIETITKDEVRSGPPMNILALTQKGRALLEVSK